MVIFEILIKIQVLVHVMALRSGIIVFRGNNFKKKSETSERKHMTLLDSCVYYPDAPIQVPLVGKVDTSLPHYVYD